MQKPVVIIEDYYQDIYITLGQAIEKLSHSGRDNQVSTLLHFFNRCESHAQCMSIIMQYVDVIQENEA